MISKYQKLVLAGAIAASLAGCSKEETPVEPVENRAPTLTVKEAGSQQEVGEQGTVVFAFNAIDAEDAYADLRIELDDSGAQGSFVLDTAGKKVTYTAPVLSSEKTLNEGATLVVRDQQGLVSDRVTLSVRVLDDNSPVTVTVQPPMNAYGFADTQLPDYVNVMIDETAGKAVFTYDINEIDGDEVELDYSVTSDSLVFDNDISAEMSADNKTLTLSTPLPLIDTPYETFTLTVTASDNDNTTQVSSVVNIINTPVLSWRAGNPTVISEREGATFRFSSSELDGYEGEYSSRLTNTSGEPLDVELNYRVDANTGELIIDPVEGFQGNRAVIMSVFLSNVIERAGEESYVHVTELSQTITLEDDRDDDYNTKVASFEEQKALLSNVKSRRDESRVGDALLTHAHLTGRITSTAKSTIADQVETALTEDYSGLEAQVVVIEGKIAAGKSENEIKADLDAFASSLLSVGQEARRVLSDWQHTLSGSPLETVRINTEAKLTVTGRLSAYVGNEHYGYFDDENKTSWVFAPEYRYLGVVNILDEFCF